MARPRDSQRRVRWEIFIPADLSAQIDLLLFSDAQGRVPYRARADFLVPLMRAELARIAAAHRRLAAARKEP